MPFSKEQITWIAALMVSAERFGLLPTRRHKIEFIRLRCVALAIFAAEQVIDVFEAKYPNDDRPRKAIDAAKAYLKDPAAYAARAARAAADAADAAADADAADAADAAADAAAAAADALLDKYNDFILARLTDLQEIN